MSVLSQMFAATPGRPGPIDDYWYQPFQPMDGRTQVTEGTALTVSTVYRGVSVLANTLAMIPLKTMRRLPGNQGKEVDRDHRLYHVLHDRPNRWQTSFNWRQMGVGHAILSGGFYNRIVTNRNGNVELIPLNPRRTCVLDQLADGRLIYEHRREDGSTERLDGATEVFHVHGLSSDGFDGIPLVDLMRRSVGLAVNTERFGAALFEKAPMMRGFLKFPGVLQADAKQQLEESLARANSGSGGWHRAPVLDRGLDWMSAGMSNEDAQFLQTRAFQVEEFARYLGVPAVLLMHADKTSTYASAEQFFQAFLTYDIAHWFTAFEQAMARDLLTPSEQESDETFFEFDRGALLRGDASARANFYRVMIELGVFTRNEVRALENKNSLPGLDDPLTPMNMERGTSEPDNPEASVPIRAIVAATAERLCHKEVAEARKAFSRFGSNPDKLTWSIGRVYEKLADDLVSQLSINQHDAKVIVSQRQARVIENGQESLDELERQRGSQFYDQVFQES